MDIMVTFRNMEPAESLRNYAEDKVSKINKYLDFPIEAHVVLKVEKFRHVADVTLSVNGAMIKGAEETGDMYSAIDQVMDKIEKQVKKYRQKGRYRRDESIKGEDSPEFEDTEASKDLILEGPVIETEKMVAKPMDPEEAAMQLNLSVQDFMVFRNSRSSKINVIYKKKDGNVGLIEPSN